MAVDVLVPDIGDFADVPVIEVLVAPGDTIAPEDPLVTLESDKASMDVPSPVAGVVEEVKLSVGDTVSAGSLVLTLTPADGAAAQPVATQPAAAQPVATQPAAAQPAAATAQPAAPAPPEGAAVQATPASPSAPAADGAYAGPAARRLARELGVDLAAIQGTGRNGRIRTDDVRRAKDGGGPAPAAPAATGGAVLDLPPWPRPDFAAQGEIESVPLPRIKKISGPVLARNWVMIPHVTQQDEADITELDAYRKELDATYRQEEIRVTLLAFLIKAAVVALRKFPDFNASLDGDNLILKRYYNIGFAADTPQGLVVPVVKAADRKGVIEIARELGELSAAAREGKLTPADMQGGTFTISSLGGIGGTGFTPIVNAPEVAILGVTRSALKPIWQDDGFVPRLMLPLSLSYDHRVIDGAAAARFARHLATTLEDVRRLLL
ncbi:MAG TPA: dihydrolipoyllysine-residue acetyltransferase [Gaiellaceae bacterium]|jgi:pyruvate dehydrogenase E2 component (dihydrolipoamide acetyltransferase)|nr:dihydrolipoyllysine-residue acetyltransferase [Gaiellaceae bacterium]